MTRRVEIDRELCNGYGNCVVTAPDVFDIDPDSNIAYLVDDQQPDEAAMPEVREAADDCPVRAIRLLGSV
ncbi:ferredoxin [Qaidamihabitans albus]|uniref:ferredoxin n=1 Tax=Qaidamihabitans albus TaxID=2795733 RepID=UPI0018F22144|nr:ferredoxin [Qaidamihabitans albus]